MAEAPSSPSHSHQVCSTCQSMKKRQVPGEAVFISEQDLEEPTPGQSKAKRKQLRQEKAIEFLKHLNALLNNGGGIICLHVENVHNLGVFDQTVNLAMANLVPDNTLFHQNVERHIEDENHVIFRVKQKRRLLSTLSFNTKISYDKGPVDPTHGQMRELLHPKRSKEEEDNASQTEIGTESYKFKKDDEVIVERSKKNSKMEIVFQESARVQAKQISREFDNPSVPRRSLKIVKTFFDENHMTVYLPKYITAFSKLPEGGSILLGVCEDTEEVFKWTKVEEDEKNELLTLNNPAFHLWKDSNDVYLVAKRSPVRETKRVKTEIFKCQGIVLNEKEQEEFRVQVHQLIKQQMYWYPDQFVEAPKLEFQPPVDVKFHEVQGGTESLVVVEITVRNYLGVAFLKSSGPIAYQVSTVNEDGIASFEPMSKALWFDKIKERMEDLEED